MRIFGFDPADHRDQWEQHGWVHVRGGVHPDFLAYLQEFAKGRFDEHHVAKQRGIGGTKEQAVFAFPEEVDFPGELFDVVASLCGLNRETMTLSERHIKAYDADAPADPPAHKDRLSSQVSVGLSIDIPEGSHLVLYPHEHREKNPFNVSAALRDSLTEDQLPENLLVSAQEVIIEDRPGDVMLFHGSSMWHKRRNAANATNLYLKFNDFGCDPLGEDPSTEERREATLAALAGGDLNGRTVVPSRRLDTITRQVTRDEQVRVVQADVWGEKPVTLTEEQAALVEGLDGGRPAAELDADSVRLLAERGVVDLV